MSGDIDKDEGTCWDSAVLLGFVHGTDEKVKVVLVPLLRKPKKTSKDRARIAPGQSSLRATPSAASPF